MPRQQEQDILLYFCCFYRCCLPCVSHTTHASIRIRPRRGLNGARDEGVLSEKQQPPSILPWIDGVTGRPGYRSTGSAAGPDPDRNPTSNDPGKSRAGQQLGRGKWKGGGRGEQVG